MELWKMTQNAVLVCTDRSIMSLEERSSTALARFVDHSFIHSFINCFLRACCLPGFVQGTVGRDAHVLVFQGEGGWTVNQDQQDSMEGSMCLGVWMGPGSPRGSGGQLSLIVNKEKVFAGHHWEALAFLAVGTAKTWTWGSGWGVQEITMGWCARPLRGGVWYSEKQAGKWGRSQMAEGLVHLAKACELDPG